MIHQSKDERAKYACRFCEKVLCYTTSIRKHVQSSHPVEYANYSNNLKLICDTIRGKDIDVVVKKVYRKLNCETDEKEQENSRATHGLRKEESDESVSRSLMKCEEIESENGIVTERLSSEGLKKEPQDTDWILTISKANSKIEVPLMNSKITEKVGMMEEEKGISVESLYGMLIEDIDRIFFQSEITNQALIPEYYSMDHFVDEHDYLYNLEDLDASHYEELPSKAFDWPNAYQYPDY